MNRTQLSGSLAIVSLAVAALVGCGSDPASEPASALSSPVINPGDGGNYHPDIEPADFVTGIDNPYLSWRAGSRWTYETHTEDGVERIEVLVTDQHKRVMGIDATVVHDTVYLDGEIIEDTFDWYAQDRDGNVWYLGEDTHEYENGKPINSHGAWQAGVNGALPGIVMPADPDIGLAYRQEYYAGKAEDMGEIIRLGGRVAVPAGEFDGLVVTRDWTPLEPEVVEEKTYARGVGLVLEEKGGERVVLVDYCVADGSPTTPSNSGEPVASCSTTNANG